ncbi:MAG: aminopeptidase [Legionella sp.]|nr:MAG: aminopeptidase [Legionella sp.]PJD97773.1 MAG: aminopeptidase [Legionella sp.]
MRLNQRMALITSGLVLASTSLMASSLAVYEPLQMPQCLASHLGKQYELLAENSEFKVLKVPAAEVESLVLLADQVHCGHFVNLSAKINAHQSWSLQAQQILAQKAVLPTAQLDYPLTHQAQVNPLLSQINSAAIWDTLTHLTSYPNRSATKQSGVDAAKWLQAQFEQMAREYGRTDTDTFLVKTGRYKQPSVVTVIGKDIKAPAVVLGAHSDTLDGSMPGAGDDGSGSASLMEAARVLLSSRTPLKNPVYIIWYAAEERGLVGSQYVVDYFQSHAIKVKAAIQLDMTGYRVQADDPTMWVFTDYTDKGLSQFVAQLIQTYIKVPVAYSRCGYGCSDHASWTEIGVPAAFPCESNFEQHNPYIHSSSDTMALLNLEHMTHFSQLALAFVIELAAE